MPLSEQLLPKKPRDGDSLPSSRHRFDEARGRYGSVPVGVCLGLILYTIAFFLPGVSAGTGKGDSYPGWYFAYVALKYINSTYGFGGVINPLLVVYLILRMLRRLPMVQSILAVAILVCIALTWVLVLPIHKGMHPELGHVLWIAGILLILEPEIHDWKITFKVSR